MKWELQLVALYCTASDNHSTIESETQRQGNNFRPQFSDEECITVYLWGIMKRRFELKAIYNYTKDHLSQWFPKLPGHQAFCHRLNRLAPALQRLAKVWMDRIYAMAGTEMTYVVDSCRIILAKQMKSSHTKIAP